jgi:hypothetical protein
MYITEKFHIEKPLKCTKKGMKHFHVQEQLPPDIPHQGES